MKFFVPAVAGAVASLFAAIALAQGADRSFDEQRDYGVPPTTELRLSDHASATPLVIAGARTVRSDELVAMLQGPAESQPLLFDVLTDMHDTLPGAIWLPGAGYGSGFDDELQRQLGTALQQASGGDRSKPMAFLCSSERCWLSYNAALRAVRLGYLNVLWYRGGIAAWLAAGGEVAPPRVRWKGPGG